MTYNVFGGKLNVAQSNPAGHRTAAHIYAKNCVSICPFIIGGLSGMRIDALRHPRDLVMYLVLSDEY